MELKKLSKDYTVGLSSESTRNGFRHVAILFKNGRQIAKATANYLNRTWESYTYQSVLHKLIRKEFTEAVANKLIKKIG